MRVVLSLDHIVQLIDSGAFHTLPEFTTIKNVVLKGYDQLEKLGGFSDEPKPGCSSCRLKKIKYAKFRLLATISMHLNNLVLTDTPLHQLTAAIGVLEGEPITKLDIPTPEMPGSKARARGVAPIPHYRLEEHKTRYTRQLKKSNGETIVLQSRTQ